MWNPCASWNGEFYIILKISAGSNEWYFLELLSMSTGSLGRIIRFINKQ